MDITNYYNLVSGENRARKYLAKKCLKNGRRFCPKCGGKKLYKLSDDRRRCSVCRYTFHDFSGRYINLCRLTYVQWLSVVKLYELEVTTKQISEQLRISYKTVYKAVDIIRLAITGTKKINGTEVFGVHDNKGKIVIVALPDVTAAGMIRLSVKKYRRGSLVFTSPHSRYVGLLSHGSLVKNGHSGSNGTLFESGSFSELQGFMGWMSDRFQKKHVVSKRQFPYFLQELEFRYNHRNDNIFELITDRICRLVPDVT